MSLNLPEVTLVPSQTAEKHHPATWNAEPKLLHEIFAAQARARATHTAVEADGQDLTYKQLDRIANRIAHWLRHHKVGPGSLVGICMGKSVRLFAALLGVMKAGAAYVPLDPETPLDRIRSIVADAGIKILLTDGGLVDDLELGESTAVLSLDENAAHISRCSRRPIDADNARVMPSDPCYVIYTSGSTGKAKGVIVEHQNAVNFVRALDLIYQIVPGDRIYQGFSVAFDASIEEIWAAFAFGATLVVPPNHVARSPLDAGDFLTRKKITVFSTVPTFLTMIEHDLQTVRLLIVGGEQCPSNLVARWAHGRRMLNTYGPTEATVVATAAECVAGEPVTIGRALPGCTTCVLDGAMNPVLPGQAGELFIGGGGVARGYVNLPELTAERFITLPDSAVPDNRTRLFRTHDLVRVTGDGSLQYVGRTDQMVKIRGFRIELSEIEAVLLEHPLVRAAAVKTLEHGETVELAAYVVPERAFGADQRQKIVELLHSRVPEYMIPRYLDVVQQLPTTISGKVDRNRLPPPQILLTNEEREKVPAVTPFEKTIVEVFERCFGVSPIFSSDDFFRDLRGHSLIAARVVSELRAKLNTAQICVRDLYAHRNAAHLAKHLESMRFGVSESKNKVLADSKEPVAREPREAVGTAGRWCCAFFQAVALFAVCAAITAPILYLMFIAIDALNGTIQWWLAAEKASTFALFVWPAWFALSIAAKWVIIGRYKPGRYRLWGLYYLRWWVVTKFQAISWCGMFVGTPLMSLYYRAMGANVGAGCIISTPFCSAFDLVSIGEGTCIGADTHVLGYRVEDGYLILGRVVIGHGCFIGVHCNLGLNVAIGNHARLDDMSMLPDGSVMRAGESRRGSPAVPAVVKLSAVVGAPKHGGTLFGAIHLALIYVMGYLLIFGLLPGLSLVFYAYLEFGSFAAAVAAFVAVPLSAIWWLLIVLFVKRNFIGQICPGLYPVASREYLRIWFLRYLLDNTRHLLVPVYATMLTPKLLRLWGAKIGRGVEVSTIMHVIPDLLEVGDGGFLADACIVGGLRIYRGWVELMPVKIGARTFVGNSALTPSGVELGKNSLIGVMSTPPANLARSPDNSRWLGSPSFELPNLEPRDDVSRPDESRTYDPDFGLVVLRGAMEALRMLLPGLIIALHLVGFVYLVDMSSAGLPAWAPYVIAPAITLAMTWTMVFSAAYVKWVLMGEFRPTVQPLWCGYIWRNEVINSVYETVAANALSMLLGTPFVAPCLRLMGCKIGRWVYLQTTLFSEFDLVNIGDRASLNLGTTVQTHLFEDRVMKADTLEIGDDCSLGNMSVVLYGVKMQPGSSLGPMSLVMKGETLAAETQWHGIPTQQIRSEADEPNEHFVVPKAA
jgi:non-ribosomal peptide synthetase-like protein